MNEADKLNRINDLELENSQLKEVLPQAFAALDMLANVVKSSENERYGDLKTVTDKELAFAERSLKWLEQFRREKSEGESIWTNTEISE